MKKAYTDISLEGLNTLLHLYPSKTAGDFLIQSVEMSPLGEGIVRFNLAGDALPETYSEEPRQVKISYEHVYDMTFPYKGVRVTLYDGDEGDRDAYQHNWKDGPSTDYFVVIHDGKPPRPQDLDKSRSE